jgi:thiol-disulfide isomerase/thioredoxin
MKRLLPCVLLGIALVAGLGAAGPGSSAPVSPSSLPLRAVENADGWFNARPLTAENLSGKVVLVDFWTYSCINCLRTLPYVKAWASKYQAAGLVVIGVHTPEFEFERQAANVKRAVDELGIAYPVALDSRQAIWRAFGNRGWPALYFIDAQGRLRHRQYGEGNYASAERLIQQLLKEAGRADTVPAGLVAPQGQGTQAAAAAVPAGSEETYLGASRASGFVSPEGRLVGGTDHAYAGAKTLRNNEWTLAGLWRVDDEYAQSQHPGGRIAYRFDARDLHLVLGTASGRPVRFRVRIDGRPPGTDHGADIDADGFGTITSQRLYQLVRQAPGAAERTFEVEFLEAGARAYAFTFG